MNEQNAPLASPADAGYGDNTPYMHWSLVVACGATLLAVLAVFGFALLSTLAAWTAGGGAGLVALGVFGGSRGAVAAGVPLIAVAALIATDGDPLPLTLTVAASAAVICMAVLLMADMSFSMRRATVVSPVTVQGLVTVHAIATAIGVALAALVVAAVLAVAWPSWLLLLPAVVLGLASFTMARQASRYSRKLNAPPERPPMSSRATMPPPPPPGSRATMPPPPPPGSRTTMPLPPAPGAQPNRQPPPPPRRSR